MEDNNKDKDKKEQEEPEQTPAAGEESKKLADKVAELESQVNSYKDLYLRKAAEFDNFKKRTEQELGSIVRFANEDLVRSILPVVDDLERSLKNARDSSETPFYKGIELILQKMLKILDSLGVKPFETVGKEFDVHYHDAMMQMPKEGVPPHTVLEEVEKGYLYHEKVLRHAKVVVSAADGVEQPVDASQADERSSKE